MMKPTDGMSIPFPAKNACIQLPQKTELCIEIFSGKSGNDAARTKSCLSNKGGLRRMREHRDVWGFHTCCPIILLQHWKPHGCQHFCPLEWTAMFLAPPELVSYFVQGRYDKTPNCRSLFFFTNG